MNNLHLSQAYPSKPGKQLHCPFIVQKDISTVYFKKNLNTIQKHLICHKSHDANTRTYCELNLLHALYLPKLVHMDIFLKIIKNNLSF